MKCFYKIFIACCLLSLIVFACTKDILIELPEAEIKYVIEGNIENGSYATVLVTRSTGFFDPMDYAALMNMLVQDAVIIVSDGNINDTLTLAEDLNVIPFYKYVGTKIIGEFGKKYDLKVICDLDTFTSQTTIPYTVTIDSMKFRGDDVFNNVDCGYVWFWFRDPDTLGNYYRFFTKTLNKDSVYVHHSTSVTDDKNVNGQYIEYPAFRGWNPNLTQEQRDAEGEALGDTARWAFIKGESVVLKFCSMDATHYEFWRTIEVQNASEGNPFAAPSSVYTNIEGGAMGVWGGYGCTFDTLHIPKN